ncbi:MAG TPA: YciI family protein [Acidimicrobiales bacterium]|nr:YciI family protein [Acidimicrobiales bacterium]
MPDDLDRQIREAVARGRAYTLVLLWDGPIRDQEAAEADRLQQEHLRHLFTLRSEGKLLLNGPVTDGGELVGIAIYAGDDREAVRALAEADPSVEAGRLRVDVRPLFGIPGDVI